MSMAPGACLALLHGLDAGEGVALVAERQGQRLHRLVDGLQVEGGAGLDGDGRVERAGVDAGQPGVDGDGAEGVAVALLDGEGDAVAGPLRVLDGLGGVHARVGEAVLEVVAAQQLLVALDALGIVERRALEDVEPAGLAGGDDVAQLARRERAVADEGDAVDLGDLALPDDEDHIDAALAAVDGLGLYGGGKPALAAVELAQAHGIGMGPGRRIAQPRLELDQRLELGLVDGALALEGHGRHDRVLDHAHVDGGAAPLDAHIGEDAGGKERLDRLVDLRRVVGAALGELQAGADGLGLDGAMAADLDGRDRLRRASRTRRPARKAAGRIPETAKPTSADASTNTGVTRRTARGKHSLPLKPAPARHPPAQALELVADCGGNGHRAGSFSREKGRRSRPRRATASSRHSSACGPRACHGPPIRSRRGSVRCHAASGCRGCAGSRPSPAGPANPSRYAMLSGRRWRPWSPGSGRAWLGGRVRWMCVMSLSCHCLLVSIGCCVRDYGRSLLTACCQEALALTHS